MSDGSEVADWALDDHELEALMAGATPDELARSGNPVAEFFSDARSTRTIPRPQPDSELRRLFASQGMSDPTVQPGSGWPTDGQRIGPRPRVQPPFPDVRPDLQHSRPLPSPPDRRPVDSTAPIAIPARAFAPMPERRLTDAPVLSVRRQPRAQVIRRAPLELALELLRPTASKLLMVVAVIALLVAAGPALGLFELPFVGDQGVRNQATEGSPSTTQVAGPNATGSATVGAADGATPLAKLPAPEIPPAESSVPTAQTPNPASSTTAPTTTTPTTKPTTVESTTTVATTTSEVRTTTTQIPTTTSTRPSTSTTATTTTTASTVVSTTSPSPSTTPTTNQSS